MKRGKKFNLTFWIILICLVVIVVFGAIYLYKTTGFVINNSSEKGIFVGSECSFVGSFACCENCGCGDGRGCVCTCSVLNTKLVWTGVCCKSGCYGGKCENPLCDSNIPLGSSCYGGYERYAEDTTRDGCADKIVVSRCGWRVYWGQVQ